METIGTDLRARRTAAYRLPPMPSGFRDPLDDYPPMSEPQRRALANDLYRQGFALEYLRKRFDLELVSA